MAIYKKVDEDALQASSGKKRTGNKALAAAFDLLLLFSPAMLFIVVYGCISHSTRRTKNTRERYTFLCEGRQEERAVITKSTAT